jgi:hypothetical protein
MQRQTRSSMIVAKEDKENILSKFKSSKDSLTKLDLSKIKSYKDSNVPSTYSGHRSNFEMINYVGGGNNADLKQGHY